MCWGGTKERMCWAKKCGGKMEEGTRDEGKMVTADSSCASVVTKEGGMKERGKRKAQDGQVRGRPW